MIRIGVVNIDTSHPKAFADYLMQEDRGRYTAVYNDGFRGDDEVEGFIKAFDLRKRCGSIEELAECVDVGFVQSCNWDDHIKEALPFIERGKPVFIDKPIAGKLSDCLKLEELARRGAVILGSSSVRYAGELIDFASTSESERGRIVNIVGTCGVDEFNYAIHIVEAITSLAGGKAVSCRFVGRAEVEDKACETFFVSFDNGVTAVYNSFHGAWQPFEMVIMTTKGTHQFRVDTSKIYGALLDRICDFLDGDPQSIAPVEEITESVKVMLAGRISRENGGVDVRLSSIPEDDPGFDGKLFTEGYAARAAKIYL